MATKRLFGTSGIRGVVGEDITPILALQVGVLYGVWLKAHTDEDNRTVAVAHDNRPGADVLAHAAANGFISAGMHVDFLGCVSTGVLAAFMESHCGGLMVTASHMPQGRISIIPLFANGHYCDSDVTDILEEGIRAWEGIETIADPENIGNVTIVSEEQSRMLYLQKMPQHILLRSRIANRSFRLLMDPGNGTAGRVAKELFESVGCRIETLHYEQKPVPDRPSECRAETCGEAIAQTVERGCHIGVCFDGDADRVLFITGKGDVLPDSVVGAIFARHYVQEGQVIVTPENASGLVEVIAKERGARVEYSRIGQPSTGTAIRAHGATFAYEEAAGKFGFFELACAYDGPFAVLKMLEIMARRGKSLAELAAEIPQFFQKAIKIDVPDAKKDAVVADAIPRLRQVLDGQTSKETAIGGIKVFLREGSWVLIRPSGTEPLVRVYTDTRVSQVRADALAELGAICFKEAIAAIG